MHDAFMPIGIRTTLTNHGSDQGSLHLSCSEVSKCFRSFQYIVGLVVLCVLGYQFTGCQCTKLVHF